MEFRKVLALRGPNVWARFPVLEAWVDLKELKEAASSEITGFNERLQTWLPTLVEHRCSEGVRGGFFERLRRGTYLAHILEHVALELQGLAGTPVGFGRTRQASEDGVYKVAVEYQHEEVGRAALEAARTVCLAAVHDQPCDVNAEVGKLRELQERLQAAPAAAAVLAAAQARSIPARLVEGSGLVQLGLGCRGRRVLDGQTDRTSAVAGAIAYDRELTASMLRAVGVPVPECYAAATAEEAWKNAEYLGLPVVLKPRYASGRGKVHRPLQNQAEVEAAFKDAEAGGWSALVEPFVSGDDYRLLVVGDKVVAACKAGDPADLTAHVHAEVAARAADAARVVGLEVAAVDVVAQDIGQPLEGQGGAVVGLHGQPDLRPFLANANVGPALVNLLYPEPQQGRIPVVSITGTNGKTTTTRLTAHILGQTHAPVGMTCTEGVYIGGRRIMTGDCSGPKSARTVLQHPAAGAAVLETARGGILREGLGFDQCDVAVVTNIGEGDHLGNSDIDTPEQLAWVKSTIVWAVKPGGVAVLNAADPLVVDMAKYCRGSVIYFARDPNHPVIVQHRAQKGKAVIVRDRQVVLAEGDRETVLVPLDRVPLTQGGRIGFHVENALASAAAGWGLDLPVDKVRAGLETFAPGMDHVPARFNILDVKGTTVIFDYGHNISALASLIETLEQFPHKWRAIVYSASGDRRDSDMIQQGILLGNAFDRVLIYEDSYMKGRKQGDIFALFRQGLNQGKRVSEVLEVRGGLKAVETALSLSCPNDLLVIQPDIIDDTVNFFNTLKASGAREITMDEALAVPEIVHHDVPPGDSGVVVGEGPLGKTAYATRAFEPGHVVYRGWGPYSAERTRFTIQVDLDRHIVPQNPLVSFNHSCEPNCGLIIRDGVEEIAVHALRPIQHDEELTLDYDTFEWEVQHLNGPCLCQSASCRGAVRGFKHLPADLRDAYGPYVAEYLRELEEAPEPAPLPAAVQPALGY